MAFCWRSEGGELIFLVNLPAGAIGLTLGWFLAAQPLPSRSRRDRSARCRAARARGRRTAGVSLARDRAGYADPLVAGRARGGIARRDRVVYDASVEAAPLIDLVDLAPSRPRGGLSSGLVSYLVLFGALFVVPYYLTAKQVGFALVGLQLCVLPVGDRGRRSDRRAAPEPSEIVPSRAAG